MLHAALRRPRSAVRSLSLSVLLALVAATAVPGAGTGSDSPAPAPTPPPGAHIGPPVCLTAEVSGAVGELCARRDRFGARWELDLTDTLADGRPVKATVELAVEGFRDLSETLENDRGAVTTVSSNGSFEPWFGVALRDISITTCVVIRFLPDRCRTRSAALPQLASRATPAQAARLEQLVFEESLQGFMAARDRAERSGVDADFDWTSDGCSAGPLAGLVGEGLEPACLRHDFAYRNYGRLFYGPTDAVRRRADEQLAADAIASGQAEIAPALSEGLQRFGAPAFFGADLLRVWPVPEFLIPFLRTDRGRTSPE